jgi:hypothetical protein
MAKRKSKTNRESQAMRQAARAQYVADLRDGRKPNRAATYADRRAVGRKRACRGKVSW